MLVVNMHRVFKWSWIFIYQAPSLDLNKLSHPTSNLYVSMGKSPLIIAGKGIGYNLLLSFLSRYGGDISGDNFEDNFVDSLMLR